MNRVVEAVWGAQELQRELVRAMQLAGCVLIGATPGGGGDLVGFVWGFAGWADGPHLHSHMLATMPALQSRGVGYALKLGQRAAALDAGFGEVRWTYDPLLARNAWFNLMKLGATGTGFLPEFYGEIGKKGGQSTAEKHGPEFYERIGKKGGQRVRELIERGKQSDS